MVLCHVIQRIRRNWPRVAITVRGDGHYGTPEVMDLLEQQGCFYILGLPGNSRLKSLSAPWSKDVATRWQRGNKEKLRRFFQTRYGAGSWSKERCVIARVEASGQGTDVRFIVTNLVGGREPSICTKRFIALGGVWKTLSRSTNSTPGPTARPAIAGRPTSSGCSCTPVPTGCC